jgi:hypothetical protein
MRRITGKLQLKYLLGLLCYVLQDLRDLSWNLQKGDVDLYRAKEK